MRIHARICFQSAQNISVDYNPGAYLESSSPIFSWYYLAIAYSQNGLCQKAIKAAKNFKELYGSHKNDYYTIDAANWVASCKGEQSINPPPLKEEIIPISIWLLPGRTGAGAALFPQDPCHGKSQSQVY